MKEKLIELLNHATKAFKFDAWENTDKIADYLIKHGVTVREKGEWVVGGIKPWNMEVGNWKCSVCKGVSLEAKNFCPNCGADMRGDT